MAKDINNENPPPVENGFGGITLAYNARSKEEVYQIIELTKKAGAKNKEVMKKEYVCEPYYYGVRFIFHDTFALHVPALDFR